MNFAKRLATLRKEAGLTQKELADKLGVSRGTIGMYEIGQRDPDTETLQKLSDIFGVSVDYLLGKTDVRNAFIPDDYIQKHKVTKRDMLQYEDFVKHVNTFFMDDKVADEDKEKLFKDISELFWKAKEINKEKYGRKKKKAD